MKSDNNKKTWYLIKWCNYKPNILICFHIYFCSFVQISVCNCIYYYYYLYYVFFMIAWLQWNILITRKLWRKKLMHILDLNTFLSAAFNSTFLFSLLFAYHLYVCVCSNLISSLGKILCEIESFFLCVES